MPPNDAALRPIPLTILTGFLGAGKTTLLNGLLRAPALADALVIVNEFGEIGLDHAFIEAADEDLVLMAAGCLCCTIRGDLIATLEDLLRRRDNARIKPFARVVIETTGLADPAPILHVAMEHPYLAKRFRLEGVVTLVDVVNGAATLDAHPEAVKQAAVADRLVLTKCDLAEPVTRDALETRLRALNPTAPILSVDAALGDPADLIDCGLYDPRTKGVDVMRWLDAESHGNQHHRGHHHDHHGHAHHGHAHDGPEAQAHADDSGQAQHVHDVNRHDASIRAFSFVSETALSPDALSVFQQALRVIHGAKLLRLKGLIKLADDPERPVVVHAVQHLFHTPLRLDAWPDAGRTTRLVVIARDLDEETIAGLWRALAKPTD